MMILPSKRAHLHILEDARVYLRHGRVEYSSDEGRGPRSFSIPVANAIFLMLGPACSITTEAAGQLKIEGVCLGFCGSGGTPLISGEPIPQFFEPADQYRDPSHLQRWISFWPDETKRLAAAKCLMRKRASLIQKWWKDFDIEGPWPPPPTVKTREFLNSVDRATSVQHLLGAESALTKHLYVSAAADTSFERQHGVAKDITDPNFLLDHGNYLAYGLASVTLWTLGIPASLAVVNGKTGRSSLVFDLGDIIKDAIILPLAFNFAARAKTESLTERDFRSACIDAFDDIKALDELYAAMDDAINEATACS